MSIADIKPGEIYYFLSYEPKEPHNKYHLFLDKDKYLFINSNISITGESIKIYKKDYTFLNYDSYIDYSNCKNYNKSKHIIDTNEFVGKLNKKEDIEKLKFVVNGSMMLKPYYQKFIINCLESII
jgi:hypothetical protein